MSACNVVGNAIGDVLPRKVRELHGDALLTLRARSDVQTIVLNDADKIPNIVTCEIGSKVTARLRE